jgi:putative ABC transport system permease protein
VRRATIASILAHKLRLVSTALAVIVGVAFVTGTLILSDTLTATFDSLFAETTQGIDLVVQGPEESADPLTGQRDPVPAGAVDVVAAVDGVAAVGPEVQGFAQLVTADGETAGGFGPPTLGINASTIELETPQVREGRFPEDAREIAVDAGTAASQDLSLGDVVGVVVEGPVQDYTVVGTVGFGDLDNLAGATLVVFQADHAFELYGQDGFSALTVIAEDGADLEALQAEVAAALGDGLEVATREQAADDASAQIAEGLGFFTTALLVFAGVALFVGAFLIANTFSIIVAQRTRELALLRAVGASRRQVMTSVLAEALATGVVGALGGFLLGVGLARGLYVLLDAFGLSLPQGDLVVSSGTFLVSSVLGTLLTTLVAVVPAARATRVLPVTALQAVAAPPPPRGGRVRYVIGGLLAAGGIAGLAVALAGDGDLPTVGGAAVVTLLGASLLAPLVTRPLLAGLGRPLAAARGVQGQLAAENALRSPRRTAATASALMIGLALVSFIAIMAASFTRSVEVIFEESFVGDFQIAPMGFVPGLGDPGAGLVEAIGAVDGVHVATTQRFGVAQVDGVDVFLGGYDPDVVGEVLSVAVVDGGEDGLLATGLAISEDVAEGEGLGVGDPVEIVLRGEAVELVIGAVYESNPVVGGWSVAEDALGADALGFAAILVDLDDDADAVAARRLVEAELEAYPSLELMDLTEVKASITGQVNQLLGLVTALLGLSVLVALFGIVNTLGLSVFERTRELGLLRAVGASRAQVRSMIRWEAVLIALLGAVFGLVIGVLFAWVVIAAIGGDAGLELAIPAGQLVGGLVAAALAGVVAAIIPARRASRIDVLRAIEAQ